MLSTRSDAAKGIWWSGVHKTIREECVSVLVHLHSYSLAMLFVLTQVCKKMKMKKKTKKKYSCANFQDTLNMCFVLEPQIP